MMLTRVFSPLSRRLPLLLAAAVGLATSALAQENAGHGSRTLAPGGTDPDPSDFPVIAPALAGSLDAGFSLTDVLGDRVVAISPQSDGNIVIGGTITQIDGVARGTLARVHADGTLDYGFVPPIIESYNTRTDATITQVNPAYIAAVFATAIQSDGKILVGGSFYFVNGVSGFGGLIRLNPDGSLDTTFDAPRFSGTVFSVVPLSNGKTLVGGDFSYVDSKHRNSLVRLDTSGHLDKTFAPGAFAGTVPFSDAVSSFPTVHTIQVQTDGKVLVGGIFTSIGGTTRRAVARLDGDDGSVDASFVPDAAFNPPSSTASTASSVDQVLGLALQADGKVVVGGDFRDPSSANPINSVYRLNSDGSLDASFNPGGAGTLKNDPLFPGANPVVNAVTLQANGQILIGGIFVAYNGTTANLVARLNTDGTLDPTFNDGDGPSEAVFALALQVDGKLLVGGTFPTADSVGRPLVARLNTVGGVPPAVVVSIVSTVRKASQAGPVKGILTVTRAGGNPNTDLLVLYAVGGNATAGVDYKALKGRVVIPGGSNSATIKVKPLAGATLAGKEKVKVILTPTAGYGVGGTGKSAVIIVPAL